MVVQKQDESNKEEKNSVEIKRLEKLLQDEQINSEKYRIAYDLSSDAININRYSDGLYISVNKAFTKMTGYTPEEVIGKTSVEKNIWKNLEDRARLLSGLKEKNYVNDLEAEFVGKDGRVIIGSMSATIILLDNVKHILNITRDITQVRKNEAIIDIERTYIEAIMENMPDHIYFKDLNSRFIKANRSLSRSLGIENPDDLIGKSDFDFFTDEHASQAFSDEQLIIKTGDVLRKTEKETYSDKSATWVSTIKLPLRDKSGKIIGTFGISRDISKEKTAEDKLLDERRLLLTLINNIPDRIYIKDVDSKFVMCNEAVMKRRGFTDKSQIIGKSDLDLLPKEVASEFITDEQKIIQTGIPLINKEEIRTDYKGFKGWTLTTKVPLFDSEGTIKGIVGIGRDITNRKRKELENSVLGEILQGMTSTNNLDELMKLIHNSLGKAIYAENFFVALYNEKNNSFSFPYFVDKYDTLPPLALTGKSCTAYVHKTGKPLIMNESIFRDLYNSGEVEDIGSPSPSWIGIPLKTPEKVLGVMVLQHYEAENYYTDEILNFLLSVSGQIALSIERKRSDDELKNKNEQLLANNAEKDKFFSIVAHDLRGPLGAFVEATEMMSEASTNLNFDEIKELAGIMKESASGIYSLLNNLLSWSRLKRGILEFNPEELLLSKCVNDCISVIHENARLKNITIVSDISPELKVMADKNMLDTIIRNLISNAVKFTPVGGSVKVAAKEAEIKGQTEISVIDTGIGIPGDLIDKLFLITANTKRKGTEGEPSSGLGLILCKEFVEKQGGTISVSSEPGKGSNSRFTL